MASVCRSFLMSGSRNLVSRSRTVTQKCINLKPTTTTTSSHFASVSQSIPRASRAGSSSVTPTLALVLNLEASMG
ncbi:unnamed protein product [Brassica oleracea var. botrytis]